MAMELCGLWVLQRAPQPPLLCVKGGGGRPIGESWHMVLCSVAMWTRAGNTRCELQVSL